MLICNRCGDTFDTPARLKINHSEIDYGYEEIDVCPTCASDDIEDADKCECCGDFICERRRDRDKRTFQDWCSKCEELAITVWHEAVEQIKECGFETAKAEQMIYEVCENNW